MSFASSKVLFVGTVLSAATLLLSGCDAGIYKSPGGIKLDDQGHVEFAVCEPIVGAKIDVFGVERRGAKEADYVMATGPVQLDPKNPLSSAEVPRGLDASVWDDPVVVPGARVNLFVYDSAGGVEFPIEFWIPDSGLSDSLWTRSDGSQHAEACE